MEPININSPTAERPPKEEKPKKDPQPPPRLHFNHAIITFISGGQTIALGSIDRNIKDENVKVKFTTKHHGTDLPYLGVRLELKRDPETKHLYKDTNFHHVLFKYHDGDFICEHRKADKKDKQMILSVMLADEATKEAVDNDKLYVVKFFRHNNRGVEVTGHGSSFVGADDRVNDAYNHLSSVKDCNVITVWLFEYENLAFQINWALEDQKKTNDPLLPYYHISKKTGRVQPHVQWDQLRPIPGNYDPQKPFERRTSYHNFADFGVMNGNAEAYNAEHAFKLAKDLRNVPVAMGTFKPMSSKDDYYCCELIIPEFENKGQLFKENDRFLICDTRGPKPLPPDQVGKVKAPKDTVPGWRAVVLSEDFVTYGDVAILIEHPTNPEHPLHDKKIRAATSVDEEVPMRYVYLKINLSANRIKGRLNALDKHRFYLRPEPQFEDKRRILVGRDLSVRGTSDWLKHLSTDRINEIAFNMNDAQRECFTVFCRNMQNGIALIHGPGGTGKTRMVAALAESAAEQGEKVLIVTSQYSAADAAIDKLTESNYMVVRAHALGLERRSMLQPNGKVTEAEDHSEQNLKDTEDQDVKGTKDQETPIDIKDQATPDTSDQETPVDIKDQATPDTKDQETPVDIKDQATPDTKDQNASDAPPKNKFSSFFSLRMFRPFKVSTQRKKSELQSDDLDKQHEDIQGSKLSDGHPADIQKSDTPPDSQEQTDDASPVQDTNLDPAIKDHSPEQTDDAASAQDTNLDTATEDHSPEHTNDAVPDQDTNLDAANEDHSPEQTNNAVPDQDIDLDEALDIRMIDIMIRVNVDFMRSCEYTYMAKDSVLRPVDQRMQKVQFSIHTWMLKLAGIVPSKWSQRPTAAQVETGVRDEWAEFRALWSKQKLGRLEDKEWDDLKKAFSRLAGEVLQRADIIACTPAVVSSELLKSVNFNGVINDETSVTTMLELLSAWRSNEKLVLIGDDFQLAPPVFTAAAENPFCRVMGYSPFARFRDLYMPAFLLNEQMRMPAGMMHLSNDVIYSGKLKDGKGTALDENPEAKLYKAYLSNMYPSIKAEPEHLIYPVMLNIHGESAFEGNGTSIYNSHNVAATIDEIIKLIKQFPAATSSNVAIATPYRAQLRKYRRALIKADKCFPELSLTQIRMGTAPYWQGKELDYMFVDLVRASNDAAELGFVRNARLLNVLITRQTLGFFVVADERCVLTLAQQSERDNPIPQDQSETFAEEESAPKTEAAEAEKKTPEDRKNATVIAIFDWMRKKGRVVNIAKESLTEDYVDFPKPYVEPVETGWGGDAASSNDKDDAGANETSANATTSADGNKDESGFVPEDHYEHAPLHDKGGEDVITGGDEEDSAVDDEVSSVGGLNEGGWANGATTFVTQGQW